jgi:hypothetical protein
LRAETLGVQLPHVGIGVGKDAGDPAASSQFPVDSFQAVGGAQAHAVGGGEVEDRQTYAMQKAV